MTSDTTRTTNALVVPRTGGSDVLEVQQIEVPPPGPGQLRVAVEAAGINFADVYQRQGIYPVKPPFVGGSEGAGTVESFGPGVTETSVGDRVAWAVNLGSAAGFALVDEQLTIPIPDGVQTRTAAAAMLQGMTAHYLVNSTYDVTDSDTILVHAAAGGVGQLLTQLAKAKGATVIGTVSTEEKAKKARDAGVDHVINYIEIDDVAAEVRQLTDGEGVSVAYDGVGKSTFESSLKSLRIRGLLALFGASSGQVPPFDLQRLNYGGSLYVTRPTLGHYIHTRDELLARGTDIMTAIADGSLRIEIGGEYPLAEARKAYDDLEGRKTTGKLLLIP